MRLRKLDRKAAEEDLVELFQKK